MLNNLLYTDELDGACFNELSEGAGLIKFWRKASFLESGGYWDKRLTAEKLDETRLIQKVLGRERQQDNVWLYKFDELFQVRSSDGDETWQGFDFGVVDFIRYFRRKADDILIRMDQNLNRESIAEGLSAHLLNILSEISVQSFIIDLASRKGSLEGKDKHARFADYVDRFLRDPDYKKSFYKEHTSLFRVLMEKTENLLGYFIYILKKYDADEEILRSTFAISSSAKLEEIRIGLGDTHDNGKSVAELVFSNSQAVMFKPKDLRVTKAYHDFLVWMNQHGLKKDLRITKGIYRETYAWEEKIEYEACSSNQQVKDFYCRFGELLGVMYLLNGHDIHYENLIAHGAHPVIIDTETLLNNPVEGLFERNGENNAKYQLANSVAGTSMLPNIGFKDEADQGVDLSALGSRHQSLPVKSPKLIDEMTDEVRLVEDYFELERGKNRPQLTGCEIRTDAYLADILAGFNAVMDIVLEHRTQLLAEEGPISHFKDVSVRAVLRNTDYYARFLLESYGPSYMTDALQREMYIDRLYFSHLPGHIVRHEKRSLLKGDVPLFSFDASKKDLYIEGEIIPGVFQTTALDLVKTKISSLSPETIKEQNDYIRSTVLSAEDGESPNGKTLYSTVSSNKGRAVNREKLMSLIQQETNKIIQSSIQGTTKKDISWIGLQLNYSSQYSLSALAPNFYEGIGGITFYLSNLYKVSKDDHILHILKSAATALIDNAKLHQTFISGFYGTISTLRPLAELNTTLQDERILKKINLILDYLAGKSHQDMNFDYLGGSAGIIMTLAEMEKLSIVSDKKVKDLVTEYADHLCCHFTKTDGLSGWKVKVGSGEIFTGYSHGSSGIALSLHKAYLLTGNQTYQETAEQALQSESMYFDHFGCDQKLQQLGFSWCKGTVGMALARADIYKYTNDSAIYDELQSLLNFIKENYQDDDHSLCHGRAGIIELINIMSQEYNISALDGLQESLIAQTLAEWEEHGAFKSGIPYHLASQGLWVGDSGILYVLGRYLHGNQMSRLI